MKNRPGNSSVDAATDDGTVVDADDGRLDPAAPDTEEDAGGQGDHAGIRPDGSRLEHDPERTATGHRLEDVKNDVMGRRFGRLPGDGVQHPDPDDVVADDLADIDHAVRSVVLSALTVFFLVVATGIVDDSDRRFAVGIAVYLVPFLVTVVLARRYGRDDGDLPPGTVGDARFVLALAGVGVTIGTPPDMHVLGIVFLYAAAGLCGVADGTRIAIVGLHRNLTFRESLCVIHRHTPAARRQAWARLIRPHETRNPGERS